MEHYFIEKPKSPLKVANVELILKNGHKYVFKTPSGVFSFKRIDKATKILIENCIIHGKDVLDIGCGYGVIGITLKLENPDINIYMSDINKRAVEFAKINAKNNNIVAEIRQSDLYNCWKEYKFDVIISNPPIVAGKRIWQKLIEGAYEHLKPGGSLQLVAYHNKGGKSISKYMEDVFGNVDYLAKEGGIRVYISKRELD
ncbi:MAG: rRNA (guanine1207-N2)-methyltransferase [Thermotogaceae bacterium]|jgi:16S rRNA G1207 methylase RsmC|nr:rRNA (guanine1207-N2)-methyltransferase [Thermotogaceae bacterium]